MKRITLPLSAFMALTSSVSYGDLVALSDASLAEETGAGVALALEDFVFDVNDAVTTVTGIESSDESQELEIQWTELYIMGEGSENGTIKTPGQVGNLKHPWLIQSVRGDGVPDYLENSTYDPSLPYAAIGSDIALLEVATDSYKNPVESTPTWGLFSVYQGCVWGQPGCDNPDDAVDNFNAVLDALYLEEANLDAKYTETDPDNPDRYVYNDIAEVEASIEFNLANQVADQEVVVAQEEEDVDVAWNGSGGVEETYDVYEDNTSNPVPKGEYADCGFFDSACNNYNDSLDVYYDEYTEYSEAKADLAEIYTDPNILVDGNGDGDVNDSADFAAGVALAVRMEDIDRYKTLCGVDVSDTSCSDGLIVTREDQKGDVETVSISLSNGVNRRQGLDIGSKFTFNFRNSSTGVVERTDYIDIDMKGVYVDGSYFRIWAREDENGDAELNANLSLNLYAKEINIATCGVMCEAAGMEQALADSTLYLDNFLLDLNLGYGEVQPLKLSATSDGNFVLELVAPQYQTNPDGTTNAQEVYKDFYDNSAKSNIFIGNIQLGTDPAKNLGSLTVDGLRASYLKVTSHDI